MCINSLYITNVPGCSLLSSTPELGCLLHCSPSMDCTWILREQSYAAHYHRVSYWIYYPIKNHGFVLEIGSRMLLFLKQNWLYLMFEIHGLWGKFVSTNKSCFASNFALGAKVIDQQSYGEAISSFLHTVLGCKTIWIVLWTVRNFETVDEPTLYNQYHRIFPRSRT